LASANDALQVATGGYACSSALSPLSTLPLSPLITLSLFLLAFFHPPSFFHRSALNWTGQLGQKVQALEFLLSLGWQWQQRQPVLPIQWHPIAIRCGPITPSRLFCNWSRFWRISSLPLKEMESKNGQQQKEAKMGRRI